MCKRFIVVVMLFCFFLSVTQVYAEGYGKMKGGHGDFGDKVFFKAMLIIKNQEELGLSDAEVKKVKDIKIASKKDLIKKKAEIDLLALDIKAALWEDTVDINAVNALIDKKYELKKEKAKSLVAALVALKGVLTEEQQEKLKGLCKKGKR